MWFACENDSFIFIGIALDLVVIFNGSLEPKVLFGVLTDPTPNFTAQRSGELWWEEEGED